MLLIVLRFSLILREKIYSIENHRVASDNTAIHYVFLIDLVNLFSIVVEILDVFTCLLYFHIHSNRISSLANHRQNETIPKAMFCRVRNEKTIFKSAQQMYKNKRFELEN